MAKLIGTAGHVDHGKTSLIRALTGIDADRLPEEKRRGMTIDVGFAYLELPDIGRVSIVDVPGHERFIANMLVGALGVNVALLCVAADESVMPQTREHLQVLELLPVERLVVAVTRADLADPVVRDITLEEVRDLLAGTRFAQAEVVTVSAVTGEGLQRLKQALQESLEESRSDGDQPWYLPVDRVFTVKGHGTVVTGPLMRGRVREGEEAQVEPGGLTLRIRQIQGHDRHVSEAESGQRTALNLSGPKSDTLVRGMVAGRPGTVFSTTVLDLDVRWAEPPRHGQRARLSIGADEAVGRLFLNDQDPASAQFRSDRPLAAVKGQPVIVRTYSPQRILGGGTVIVPQAVKRRRSETAVRTGTGSDEDAVLAALASRSAGAATEDVCRVVGKTPQALGSVFEALLAAGAVQGFAGLWFRNDEWDEARARFLKALGAVHEEAPTRILVPREAVVAKAALAWKGKPLDRIVARLEHEGAVRVSGTLVGLEGRTAVLSAPQRSLLDRVKTLLDEAGVNVPDAMVLSQAVGVPPQAVSGIMQVGLDAGEVVRVAEGLVYTRQGLANVLDSAQRSLGGQEFTAGGFKEALGTSRKYAIPLLEHFDAKGWTVRRGDVRVFVTPNARGPQGA
ncbi:MAG: selenocysteine-specific translation elongation factor [Armatimonadetes bacterium]|nr:selenocysteine-specific translation elongation factor [Armatimonadota bacterium]